jgi:hypothetical protein
MVRTCGTVISIVTTERNLRIFSKPPTEVASCRGLSGVQSGGSIDIVVLRDKNFAR